MSKKNDTTQQEPAASGSPAAENQQAASGSPAAENQQADSGSSAAENPQANSGSPAAENQQADSGSPAGNTAYDDLLKNGTAILEAPTREALAELVNNIPADCRYSVGAVGRNRDNGTYTLRVDVTKK